MLVFSFIMSIVFSITLLTFSIAMVYSLIKAKKSTSDLYNMLGGADNDENKKK